MKFQIPNMLHSKVNRRTHTHTHTLTHTQTDKPKAICPSNFFKVGGIKRLTTCLWLWFKTHVPSSACMCFNIDRVLLSSMALAKIKISFDLVDLI